VLALLTRYDLSLSSDQAASLREILSAEAKPGDPVAVKGRVDQFLRSDESILEEEQYPWVGPIAEKVVALGPRPKVDALATAVRAAIAPPTAEGDGGGPAETKVDEELIDDLVVALQVPLSEAWRGVEAEARAVEVMALVGDGLSADARPRLKARLDQALLDLQNRSALAPLPEPGDVVGMQELERDRIEVAVSGTPVLYRGMSQSVTANQFKSLALALGLVLVIMVGLFRSITAGLLAASPTVVTLVVIYGAMGVAGVHLDIGTSMLASIIIGAGVDYAVHLLSAWRGKTTEEAGREAALHTGTAIWTNALMVAAGFFVLTLGEAKPLENVGGLTSAAMVAAALATFLAIPALARRTRYVGAEES
jgi:hypothetical protein